VRGAGAGSDGFARAPATFVLIGLNVIAYLVEIAVGGGGFSVGGANSITIHYGLFGPLVAEGEWYRLVTSGFLHGSFLHIGFNMALLYFLGRLLEPALGTPRFLLLYAASLLAGSFGVMLVDPNALTYGASGAVFGLAGAVFVIARGRGMDALAGEIGFLIVINLVLSFTVPHISVGGHVGGLIGGTICALVIVAGERGMLGANSRVAEYVAMLAVAIGSVVGALAVA
jgi:membrane associated rhomboid family serine protease